MDVKLPISLIAELTQSESVVLGNTIQSLWSGYGVITRVDLVQQDGQRKPAVAKYVSPPSDTEHKYGWQGDVGHQRKLSSYRNEFLWYQNIAPTCSARCRFPQFLAGQHQDPTWLFVLEDLDHAGFPNRLQRVNDAQLESCLEWLASFHATFLRDEHESPVATGSPNTQSLWPVGTYWHLATRPDELAAMPESDLKQSAAAIDRALTDARFQTLVHGDAKLANFCFSDDDRVAAVDFQYVGGGCGMKDLAYFVSSCFDESECERREAEILDRYFACLRAALSNSQSKTDSAAIESSWRPLYAVAWADFYRFLAGWSPGHWKIHRYSQKVAAAVVASIGNR